jgi:hypothetical protein
MSSMTDPVHIRFDGELEPGNLETITLEDSVAGLTVGMPVLLVSPDDDLPADGCDVQGPWPGVVEGVSEFAGRRLAEVRLAMHKDVDLDTDTLSILSGFIGMVESTDRYPGHDEFGDARVIECLQHAAHCVHEGHW